VAEPDPRPFLEKVVASLLDDVSRGEIPAPVRAQMAQQAAAALTPVIATLGVADPIGEIQHAFATDPGAEEGMQARQIARTIRASLDVVWPSPDDQSPPPSDAFEGRRRTAPAPSTADLVVPKEIEDLFTQDADVFAELDAFEAEVYGDAGAASPGTAAGPPPPPPPPQPGAPHVSRWQLAPVKGRLMTMLRASRRVGAGTPDRATVYPHRVKFEEALSLEAEFGGLDRRHALATRLAEDARRNPDLRAPGRSVGNDVHTVLQDRFLLAHGHAHVIVQEWWVYYPGRRHRETITEARKRELTEPDPAKADFTYFVIEKARRRMRGPVQLESRWDNVDLSSSHLWEIKPLARMQEGVLQESYYQAKYRFCALELLDGRRRVRVPWLDPGPRYPIRDRFTNELFIRTRFGAVAMPVSVHSELPGVVPYVVLRRTTETDMVELIQRVLTFIKETYANLKRIARIVRALIAIAIIVAFLIALIVVWIASIIANPPPDEELEPVPILVPKRKKEGVIVRGWMALAPDQGSLLAHFPGGEQGVERAESITLGIGGLFMTGVPVASFGDLLSRLTDAIDQAMHAWARTKPPEPTGPPVS
jgi:hypothetical protein